MNSSSEKEFQDDVQILGISSNILVLICRFWAVLNEK